MSSKTVTVKITHKVTLEVPEGSDVTEICNEMDVSFSSSECKVLDTEMTDVEGDEV